MQPYLPAVATLLAYLVGSLPFAVIVSRLMGLADPRQYGSHNPGATNVLRSGNKLAATLTLLLDALKGYVPVLLVSVYGHRYDLREGTVALVGLAAFVGHLWPLFIKFRGGKGVATAGGALFAFNPWLGAATLITWAIIAFLFRYASLASIVAAVFAPFFQVLIWGAGVPALVVGIISLLLLWRHSSNVNRLLAGTESKLGCKGVTVASKHAQTQQGTHGHQRARGATHRQARGKS